MPNMIKVWRVRVTVTSFSVKLYDSVGYTSYSMPGLYGSFFAALAAAKLEQGINRITEIY